MFEKLFNKNVIQCLQKWWMNKWDFVFYLVIITWSNIWLICVGFEYAMYKYIYDYRGKILFFIRNAPNSNKYSKCVIEYMGMYSFFCFDWLNRLNKIKESDDIYLHIIVTRNNLTTRKERYSFCIRLSIDSDC